MLTASGHIDLREAKSNPPLRYNKKTKPKHESKKDIVARTMAHKLMKHYPRKRSILIEEELLLYCNYLENFCIKPEKFKTRLTHDFITLTLSRREADKFLPKLLKDKRVQGEVHERVGQVFKHFIHKEDQMPSEVDVVVPAEVERLVSIKVHDVDINIYLRMVEAVKPCRYNVSEVELALDMTPKAKNKCLNLHDFFGNHHSLMYPGRGFDLPFDGTIYPQNNRQAKTKQARNYIKEEDRNSQNIIEDNDMACSLIPKVKFVRLEITLKRNALRRMQINSLLDVLKIDGGIIVKYLQLKTFNFRLFRNRYLKVNGKTKQNRKDVEMYSRMIAKAIQDLGINQANRLAKQILPGNYLDDHPYGHVFNRRASKLTVFSPEDINKINAKYPFGVIL